MKKTNLVTLCLLLNVLLFGQRNDLVSSEEFYGTNLIPYTKIPLAQIQPINFAAKVTNIGSVDQTQTILTTQINGGSIFTATSSPVAIQAVNSDSLFTNSWTPPTAIGVPYNITLTASSNAVDETPSNNSITFPPIEITKGIYALDDAKLDGAGGGYNNNVIPATEDFEAGNLFEIFTTAQVHYIDVFISENTKPGAVMDVSLYSWMPGGGKYGTFTPIDRSIGYVVKTSDIGTIKSLPLNSKPTLNSGNKYFAAVHGWFSGGGSIPAFFYGTSGSSPAEISPSGATSFIFYPSMDNPNVGEDYSTTSTPMVRLNFNPCATISGKDTRVECNSLLWLDGNTYTSNNNSASFNIINGASNGCDSLVLLDLAILNDTSIYVTNDTIISNQLNASYRWLNCNSNTIIPNETSRNFAPSSSGDYAVETTVNGCNTDTSACINMTIPCVAISGKDSIAECDSLLWLDGNTYTSNNNSASFNIINGASNGCDSLVLLDLTILNDTSTYLTKDSIGSNQLNASYRWIDCNSNTIIPNETSRNFAPKSSGDYAVEITVNGCDIDTSACVNIIITSIDKKKELNPKVHIYPNPGSNQLTINTELAIAEINIIDITGRSIKRIRQNMNTINVSDLLNGIYFIQISSQEKTITKKFMKE